MLSKMPDVGLPMASASMLRPRYAVLSVKDVPILWCAGVSAAEGGGCGHGGDVLPCDVQVCPLLKGAGVGTVVMSYPVVCRCVRC